MPNSTREVRNGKPSRLTTGLLLGSMLFGLAGCLTPEGRYAVHGTAFNTANQIVSREIDEALYKPEIPQYSEPQRIGKYGGDYLIVINLANGEAQEIWGEDSKSYQKKIWSNRFKEYPKGFIIQDILNGKVGLIIRWKPDS